MRVPAIVVGVAVVLTACGGQKKPEATGDSASSAAAGAPAATAATGVNHDVQMVQAGANAYKFVPDNLTIKAGDQVTFKAISGTMHDVAFYPDSIPPGAAPIITAALGDNKSSDLATNMINEGQSISVAFTGAPAGVYKLYCIPHQAMGMHMTITVQ